MVMTTGTKGEPKPIPSGASPTFAADMANLAAWVAAGRGFRRAATLAALNSTTGNDQYDLGIVDAIPGAWFKRSASAWVMCGVAQFADASARNSAIPSPVAGMRSRLASELFDREYLGGAWTPVGPGLVLPSAATNGTVSAAGVVTSTAQSLVRVRDAFPAGFRVFRVDFDVTTSAASGLAMRFAVGATDSTTNYDYQRTSEVDSSVSTVKELNQGIASISPIGVIARHVGEIIITDPNVASPTAWRSSSVGTANPMTTGHGRTSVGGSHRPSTAYDSLTVLAGSGNVTVNRLTVEGIS